MARGNSLRPNQNYHGIIHPIYLIIPLAGNQQWLIKGKCGINTLRPRQNGHHFADDTFKRIFLNGNVWISIKISLKFVPKAPINKIPALVQIMACHQPGNKPLSEPMMVSILTHKCATRPQWVNIHKTYIFVHYGTQNQDREQYHLFPYFMGYTLCCQEDERRW